MSFLSIQNLSKRYAGQQILAVDNVSFEIEKPGTFIALVGESGSGKTTFLRMLAGLEQPTNGTILLSNTVLFSPKKSLPPHKRDIGLVFQDYALFPHYTVKKNIAFGLNKLSEKEKINRIDKYLSIVGLTDAAHKYPHELSGGQQQRVALARALATEPKLLLLDEPFSNLDGILKKKIRQEIKQIIDRTGVTTIFVTHDTIDALSVADEIIILKDGQLLQHDTPEKVYSDPANIYIAKLFGEVNVFEATIADNLITSPVGTFDIPRNIQLLNKKITLCIRPDEFTATKHNTPIKGEIKNINYYGTHKEIEVILSDQQLITARISNTHSLNVNEVISLSFDRNNVIILAR